MECRKFHYCIYTYPKNWAPQVALVVKDLPANAGDTSGVGSVPRSGRSPAEGNGNPLPVFLPGESQGRGNVLGCRLWGCTESDVTEATYQQQQQQPINKFSLFSSVQFSHSVVSDSLQPHESKHTRPPCPSPTPRVHRDSCPWSQ